MKTALLVAALCFAVRVSAGEIIVQKAQGEVSVRHGVTEVWVKVSPGDILRPDDTMKTGKKGSAVIVLRPSSETGGAQKTLTLPGDVIVDMSDVRDLTQEELMLKLTMEKVRASSYQWKSDDLQIPSAAVVHGEDRGSEGESMRASDPATGVLQLNGAHVLFENGFYATCALKGLEVFRMYPALGKQFRSRMMVAEALEKANLRGEAVNEYASIASIDGITAEQRNLLHDRIEALRKQ
ncbi:MAG TPA: hypothetical protein VMF59_13570 [Bacteroidota bacterium]|nr:hypothetical protein [Bacteroidota bacterium]